MSTPSQLKSVHRRTLSEFAARRGRTRKRLVSVGATLALLLSMTVVASVSANTGSITKSEDCATGAVHVFLNNNVSADRKVTVTSTIPDFTDTGITDKSYTTTGNAGPVEIWTASGPQPFAGVVTLTIKYANGETEDFHTATLTAQEPCPKEDTDISTDASGAVVLGGHVSDSATLSGGDEPGGTITFKLYGPNNATCAGAAVFTSVKDVDGNGTYGSGNFTPAHAGTYRWIASYSGDDGNKPAAGACGDENEQVEVTKAHPSISTDASGTVDLGGLISDTATLSGGHAPTGTITFNLYGPNTEECDTDPIFTSTKDVAGNGDYGSGTFSPSAVGTYRWIAAYSGDADNLAVSGACNDANEAVVVTQPEVKTPDLHVIKLVATGSDEFGPTSVAQPGDIVHFRISIHNTGNGDATGVDVSDDINAVLAHSTYNADCSDGCSFAGGVLTWSDLSIDAGATEVLTFSVTLAATFPDGTTHLPNVVVVQGPGSNCIPGQGDEDCDTDTTVSASQLTITKTNNAPIETLQLPDGSTADLPTAEVGSTVVYTLHYTFSGDPETNGIITDVVPEGLQYVAATASSNDEFTFVGYDGLSRTLSWTAERVTKSGSLTYSALVLDGANELVQPLTNIATIDSDQTEPDSDTSDVFVPVIPQGETNVPTPPATDTAGSATPSDPGISLPLVLAILGMLVLTIGILTPVPAPVRRRHRR